MKKKFVRRPRPIITRNIATPADHIPPRQPVVAYRDGKPVVGPYFTRPMTKAEVLALPHFREWLQAKAAKLSAELSAAQGKEVKVELEATERQAAKYRQLFPGRCRVRGIEGFKAPAVVGAQAQKKTRPGKEGV